MEKGFKVILSIIILILAATCFTMICKSLDKNIDLLSWCGGCAFYMLGQLFARWIYE